ncbi:hypothetical protein IFR05_003268 [Cadophora sp. M221]|nr:hypothetical protein IFR05_003268 [Cadophora sp. M221]
MLAEGDHAGEWRIASSPFLQLQGFNAAIRYDSDLKVLYRLGRLKMVGAEGGLEFHSSQYTLLFAASPVPVPVESTLERVGLGWVDPLRVLVVVGWGNHMLAASQHQDRTGQGTPDDECSLHRWRYGWDAALGAI